MQINRMVHWDIEKGKVSGEQNIFQFNFFFRLTIASSKSTMCTNVQGVLCPGENEQPVMAGGNIYRLKNGKYEKVQIQITIC